MSQKIRIHEIRSIEEVYKYIDNKGIKPYILIDIDDTVFKVKWDDIDLNEYFRNSLLDGFKYNFFRQDSKGNFTSYCSPLYRGIVRNFNWIIEHPEAKYKLVEGETTCKVIKDLQKNYQTSFITARGLELHKVTEKNLRKHGLIRGKYITDTKIPLSFLEAGVRSPRGLSSLGGNQIFFTAGRPKGKILDSYFVPGSSKSLVLMIDDSLGALQSVGEFYKKYNIIFIGLHYKPILNKYERECYLTNTIPEHRGSRYNAAKQREKRYEALKELAEQAQELDMGYGDDPFMDEIRYGVISGMRDGGVRIDEEVKRYLDKNNITITHGIKPQYYTTHVSLTPSIEKPLTLDDAIKERKVNKHIGSSFDDWLAEVEQPVIKSTNGSIIELGLKKPASEGEIMTAVSLNNGRKVSNGKTPLELVPLEFLEYFVTSLKIGLEKNYAIDNWKSVDPTHKTKKKLAATIRHLIAFERGKRGDNGDFIEYKSDGTPCETTANHLSAALFNIAWIIWGLKKHGIEEDDRDEIR